VAQQDFDSARFLLQLKHYDKIVTVMMPREKWTDERLDELNKKVDDGFERLDKDIRELRGDIKELSARFDALNGRLIAGFFVIIAAIIGSNAL
jgi:hypothetical protein